MNRLPNLLEPFFCARCAPKGCGAKAFTLVELLVVVAIIGIMVTLAMLSLRPVLEKARKAKCASQMHQISLSIFAYAQDHDATLPPAIFPESSQYWWYVSPEFDSYTGLRLLSDKRKMFSCPSWNGGKILSDGTDYSYSLCYPYAKDNYSPPKLLQYPKPSKNILLFDGAPQSTTSAYTWTYFNITPSLSYFLRINAGSSYPTAFRHNQRMNVLFVDGHIADFASSQITAEMIDTHQ